MHAPLVSIITPTFNHEHYIGDCIESVLSQTYTNWEQIIVDDCSSDQTLGVTGRYRDPRIRCLQKPRHGGPEDLHTSYNTALRMARGELIAVLEGDDYWPDEKLSIQVPFHDDKTIVLSWGRWTNKLGEREVVAGLEHGGVPRRFPDTSHLLVRNMIAALTVVMTRKALQLAGGFWQPAGTSFVDHPTWLRLSTLGEFLYVPEQLGVYRLHANQISQRAVDGLSLHNYPYAREFTSKLDPARRRQLRWAQIRASQRVFEAEDCFRKGQYGGFFMRVALALARGDRRTRLECARLLLLPPGLGLKRRFGNG